MMLTVDSKRLFPLDPNLIYLNHGAFGVTPHDVLNEKRRILYEIEKNPVDFLQFKISERWQQIANTVAKRFLCDENSVAIVDNATDGAVAVLRALSLKPSEEILITQLTYNAISLAARHIAEAQGARVNVAMLRFPDPNSSSSKQSSKP
jgi:isopenicillin-N epimerase